MSILKRLQALAGRQPSSAPPKMYYAEDLPMIDHHQARKAQQDGATLVDVRELYEWQAGHAADAVLHPVGDIAGDPDIGLAPDTQIVTYCKAGARAERAAELLKASGYENVVAMDGGFDDWRDAGYPVE